MNKFQLSAIAALLGASAVVSTTVVAAETTREQRMEQARKNYDARNPGAPASQRMSGSRADAGAGPMARTEASMKRGAKRAGSAIERGAKKTGNAIKRGATKTKAAVARTGERMGRLEQRAAEPEQPVGSGPVTGACRGRCARLGGSAARRFGGNAVRRSAAARLERDHVIEFEPDADRLVQRVVVVRRHHRQHLRAAAELQ